LQLNSLFAHPIGELMLDYDNQKLVSDAVDVTKDIETKNNWECEVTSSYMNIDLNDVLMSKHLNLLEQVINAGNEYLHKVGWDSDGGYVAEDWWFNLYENEHWQESHHHGTHDLCAIYYATPDLTPTLFLNPNDYTFHQRYHKLDGKTEFTKTEFSVLPQPGKLVIFPGYMFHRVPSIPQTYIQRRLTLAFNFGKDATRLKKVLDISKGV
jgi:hypothetical protein